jgi:predicted Zn-ribbon and HTH transcriptional regulator
MLHDY